MIKLKLLSVFILCNSFVFGQEKYKELGSTLHFSTSLIYNNRTEKHSFGDPSPDSNDFKYVEIPSQLLSPGFGFHWINKRNMVHDIFLSKLSLNKTVNRRTIKTMSQYDTEVGYGQTSSVIAMRYEIGKVYKNNSKISFGTNIGIEPAFVHFSVTSYQSNLFYIKGYLIPIDISIIPYLIFNLSKAIKIELKSSANFRTLDMRNIREYNPSVPLRNQDGQRYKDDALMSFSIVLHLKYIIKESSGRKKGIVKKRK